MKRSTDIEKIVKQAARNNPLAQRELYKRYYKEMLGMCIRMLSHQHLAEDVLQDGFVKAFSKLKQLKTPEKFGGWLKRIIMNECLNYIKTIEHFEPVEGLEINDNNADDNWYEGVSFEEISSAIDQLPIGCRQIITLYLIEEYKQKEIAEQLNLSISTVKSQYQYALTLLRTQLKDKVQVS